MTWLIGGAACAIFVAAGVLVLNPPDPELATPVLASSAHTQGAAAAAGSALAKSPAHLPESDPLNIAKELQLASERAKLWHPKAALAGIEAIVEDGRPVQPVIYRFSAAVGAPYPGAPLLPESCAVSFESGAGSTKEETIPEKRIALPEPNCPLEVAYRTVRDTAADLKGKVGIQLLHSQRHGRSVWLFSLPDNKSANIDADTCTVLRR